MLRPLAGGEMAEEQRNRIDAKPTKSFFVDMLTRDIALDQAILDLVDNSVDGAKRLNVQGEALDGKSIRMWFDKDRFRMVDNCGGFDRGTAKDYAFRFGRAKGATATPNSIGQFGIGMKRALFKFGRHFIVRSATADDAWAVDVDVDKWEDTDDWHFEWTDFGPDRPISTHRPGTEIKVDKLRSNVSDRFGTRSFENNVMDLIKSKHRQFISKGLSVRVNGRHISALEISLLDSEKLKPGVDRFDLEDKGEKTVTVTIKVGLGASSPRDAGWYVICNGRVVLEADRTGTTGWGYAEAAGDELRIPGFHNQFSRFRGIASFDCVDSKRVPWTTTKNDVDTDSSVWIRAFPRMNEMMRPVIDFLNEVSEDIEENTREESPMLQVVTQATAVRSDALSAKRSFAAPSRNEIEFMPTTTTIQYSKKVSEVEFLKKALGVGTAKAVGQKTFEMILKRQQG